MSIDEVVILQNGVRDVMGEREGGWVPVIEGDACFVKKTCVHTNAVYTTYYVSGI